MSSNRVALASLDTNIDSPKGLPLHKHKLHSSRFLPKIHVPVAVKPDASIETRDLASPAPPPKPASGSGSGSDSLPLTPSTTPKLGLSKTTSLLVPLTCLAVPARKMETFANYRITHGKNVKADLAATKLKLRLQLAFYKLKAQKDSLHARKAPEFKVSPTVQSKEPRTFSSAANINLQKPRTVSGPLLNTVASNKVKKPSKTLKLKHIKQTSSFHNAYPQQLPLNASSVGPQRLPPVHKILKTPIKTTTRNLVHHFYNNQTSQCGVSSLSNFHLAHRTASESVISHSQNHNSDETIDDSVDDADNETRKKNDPLGLSPSRFGTFSTPNSFSVAKSLLQLGLGYY